jgi:4-hydroxy-tetrahydrodipicolinate reductase
VKIAVVGYGRMGREVESVLRERSHEPVVVPRGQPYPAGCVVGIDFTKGEAVAENVRRAIEAGSRYVVGTTGWEAQRQEVERFVKSTNLGLVHAANFSLGVNLFYRIVREAAALFARFPDYDPYILERHHRQKRDAPSGTARALAMAMEKAMAPRLRATTELGAALPPDRFHVSVVRAGGIVGDHAVGFDSGGDEILLEHRARSRRGFALGAVMAAEWIATRSGVYVFETVLADLLGERG